MFANYSSAKLWDSVRQIKTSFHALTNTVGQIGLRKTIGAIVHVAGRSVSDQYREQEPEY